jgi:hypothetical protein
MRLLHVIEYDELQIKVKLQGSNIILEGGNGFFLKTQKNYR